MILRSTLFATVFGLGISYAGAAERQATLQVQNMTCAACPAIVEGSLQAVPGVTKVDVSFENSTALVTFDDAVSSLDALIEATTNAGFPAILKL